MLTVWQSTMSSFKGIADYVRRQFTFASGTPLEEVSNTLGTLVGAATISGNKLVQPGGYSYLSWPNTTFAANQDFTYEAWINIQALPSIGQAGIMTTWNNGGQGNNGYILYVIGGALNFTFTTADQSTSPAVVGPAVSLNANHHVAVSRTNGVIRLFVDEVVGTQTVTSQAGCFVSSFPTRTVWANNQTAFVGSMWNIRQTHNMSLYTGNFTPPTSL